MGQCEGWKPSDPEALVLPGQHVISQVDFLVEHGEFDFRVLTGNHLTGSEGERSQKSEYFNLGDPINFPLAEKYSHQWPGTTKMCFCARVCA